MHTCASNSKLVEPLPEPVRTLNRRLRQQYRRVSIEQRNAPPAQPKVVYALILDINYFCNFLDIHQNYNPIDDEPMWAVDCVVALALGSAITIPKTSNEFAIKRNHLTLVKGNQFDADKQSARPSGYLPSNTQPNPKGSSSKPYQSPQVWNEHVNAVFTLSGKSYDTPINPNDQQNDSETPINFDSEDEDEESTPQSKSQTLKPVIETLIPKPYKLKIPYPQCLRKEKMEAEHGDSPWLSPIHCVPKKGGIIVVTNEKYELVPTRTVTGWRVCIDYRKLYEATTKDHFPLPFMDQMLERLTGNKYFYFPDGFSGYFQIPIEPMDQEKTTFTCPFRTYAYRRMPFGLCNASATFQRTALNGVAERKNCHLLEVARALLFQMTVPKPFWADDVSAAYFLVNCMPYAILGGNYPYLVLFPTKPLFPIDPKIFGSTCFVQDTQPNITKLDPKSLNVFFLDTPVFRRGIDVILISFIELDGPPLKVYARRPQIRSDLIRKPSTQLKDTLIDATNDALNDVSNDAPNDVSNYVPISAPSEACDSILVLKTVGEALAYSRWRAAMIEEMNALDHNGTWALVDLPVHKKAIGCKWVFSIKMNPTGLIARLKARLALHQLDMKNAFLHGYLEEEVYMEQPPGFVALGEFRKTKDLGLLKYFLGIEVSLTSKLCDELMIPKLKLRYEDGRFLHNPEKYRTSHWDAVTQILGYLKGTPGLGILYANHRHNIAEGFTDADYAGCPNTSCSTMGYCIFVGGNLVSWKSEISFPQSKPMKMWCDNQAAIYIATNLVFHERTKHIENMGNTTANASKVIRCYNCRGKGHIARQCTQPKRAKNSEWFNEKMQLAQAQEARVVLDEEHTDGIDAFDSHCDGSSTVSVVFMENLSAYGSDVLSEVAISLGLRFVSDCDLTWTAFCLASTAICPFPRSCILSLKYCVLPNSRILRFVSEALPSSRDHPPMLATGRYPQWRSRFLQYINTRPNGDALRECILSGPYKPTTVLVQAIAATDDSPAIPEHTTVKTPMNMSPENKAHFQEEKEAIHLILTGFGDEIYSTVDAFQTTQEIWEATERLQQGEPLNIQDVKTNLFWEFGEFTSHDGETMESYYMRFYKLMNEMIRNNLTVATMQVNV
nr:reverse transcriptase domain-containing protein [Tanacetum cinerariifolium]